MLLLDTWMPDPDVAVAYSIEVAASPPVVYDALLSTDFHRHPLVALLMGLRMLPAAIAAPGATWARIRAARAPSALPLRALLNRDFVLLQEVPGEELVLGLTGRFWAPSGGLAPTDPASFRDSPPPGMARGAWSFRLEPIKHGATRLLTETRVRCSDPRTLKQFQRYWRLVAPGSGLLRWAILRQVRARAERAGR